MAYESVSIEPVFNLNKSVERQKDVLILVVKGLWKKCVQLDWSTGLKVMSTFSRAKARQGVVRPLVIQLMNLMKWTHSPCNRCF